MTVQELIIKTITDKYLYQVLDFEHQCDTFVYGKGIRFFCDNIKGGPEVVGFSLDFYSDRKHKYSLFCCDELPKIIPWEDMTVKEQIIVHNFHSGK